MFTRSALPAALAALLLMAACSTVPLTGRRQLSLVPASQMQAMSYQQYDGFLKENKLSTNAQQTAMVKRVGERIQRSVEQYMSQKGLSDQLAGYQWEVNLVENPEVNAWCMPGGKIVVYTGLLPVARDETGLAVVMGHEVAHAIARHGDERMSQGMLQEFGGMALSTYLEQKPAQTQQVWMTAYGLGSTLGVMLPYSRTHESEADHMGLIFMAMAGYNPDEALSFWERMAAGKAGAPPEFLSTHPSDQTRIANLRKLLPEARKRYHPQG
jgi:predicted Zn-dependent protease